HPHPVCFLDGQICRFETSGPLIGVNAAAQYSSQKIVLKGGEIFLFFTDGLTELANHQNQFFGEEKIVEYFEEFINQDENFENILSDLLEKLNTFREDAEVEDDISMLAMRVSLRLGLT
ncbi:MAG: serine/threonine-protein phosphatase, partial [Leptospiraceae bacterium]|nr:serine/threonine-protein phosphatase [Leptospiraceae bacterium]